MRVNKGKTGEGLSLVIFEDIPMKYVINGDSSQRDLFIDMYL